MKRVIFTLISVAVVAAAAYTAYDVLQMPNPTRTLTVSPAIEPLVLAGEKTVYRIGMLPAGFPKNFVPLEYRQDANAQKKVYQTGTEEYTVRYAVPRTFGTYADAFINVMEHDGWAVGDNIRSRTQAFIRAKRGTRETVHAVVTATSEGKSIMAVVYSKEGN